MNDFWLDNFHEYDMMDDKKSGLALLPSGFVSVLRHKQYYFLLGSARNEGKNGND